MRCRATRAASAAIVLCLLAWAGPPNGLSAEVLTLTSPATVMCVTNDGAVFTVDNGALRPVRGQFMLFPPGEEMLRPRTAISQDGEPGQLLRMRAWSAEPLDSLVIEVGTPGQQPLSRTRGFKARTSDGTDEWVAFLGIPAWTKAGDYSLTLTAKSGARSFLFLEPFTVAQRSFFSETIALGTDLTELVAVPDARKAAESRILWQVLTTPHADALFETAELLVPLPGARRTSRYGDRRQFDYSDGTAGSSVHLGVDIASPEGTLVPSSGRGKVVFASKRILTGNTVIVEHLPGLFTVYYHLSSMSVKVGQLVERGEVIGAVGMTGFATGPHLHWEVQDLGTAVDPDRAASGPLLDKPADFPDIDRASSTEGR